MNLLLNRASVVFQTAIQMTMDPYINAYAPLPLSLSVTCHTSLNLNRLPPRSLIVYQISIKCGLVLISPCLHASISTVTYRKETSTLTVSTSLLALTFQSIIHSQGPPIVCHSFPGELYTDLLYPDTRSVYEFNSTPTENTAPSPSSGISFPADIAALTFPTDRGLDSELREPDLAGIPAETLSFGFFDECYPISPGSCPVPAFALHDSESTFIGSCLTPNPVNELSASDIAIPLCKELTADSQSMPGDEYIGALLQCDRQVKLERLAYLREEKERIAKQERQLGTHSFRQTLIFKY